MTCLPDPPRYLVTRLAKPSTLAIATNLQHTRSPMNNLTIWSSYSLWHTVSDSSLFCDALSNFISPTFPSMSTKDLLRFLSKPAKWVHRTFTFHTQSIAASGWLFASIVRVLHRMSSIHHSMRYFDTVSTLWSLSLRTPADLQTVKGLDSTSHAPDYLNASKLLHRR
jgi:hypothetical protein